MNEMLRPQRIVILGAGFAGLYAYLELHKQFHGSGHVQVTLVNNGDQFVFVPLIHEVATGSLFPGTVTRSLRSIPWCCMHEFIDGKAVSVDLDKKRVRVEYHEQSPASLPESKPHHHHKDIEYDYIIFALGSETNFFGVPGAREYALSLNTLNDARRIKNTIIERFEEASRLSDPEAQKEELQFIIAGGGPNGVEVAGEMEDLFSKEMEHTFPHLKGLARIIIIEGSDRLMKSVGPWFSERVERAFERLGYVYIMFEKRVTKVTPEGVELGDMFLRGKTVIWSGGVRARDIAITSEHPITREEKTNRIRVTDALTIEMYDHAYVAGDQAWVCNWEIGQAYPMRAQFAYRQGIAAAQNIARAIHGKKLEPFSWKERGFIVSLGRGGAFAEMFGIKFGGPIAWLIYRAAYLVKVVGWRSKIRTAGEWFLNLFLPRDISKL